MGTGRLAVLLLIGVGGCSIAERLSEIGRPPTLSPIVNPVQETGYRPVSLPMPDPEPMPSAGANSLWRSGAKGFFRDQRARTRETDTGCRTRDGGNFSLQGFSHLMLSNIDLS